MKKQKYAFWLLASLALSFLLHCAQSSPTRSSEPIEVAREIPAITQPKRVMVLVFDQLRPDLIERFQMKHFLRLQKEGISFPQAIVGHLASVTVVSHPVITTGLLPKHLPWQDEFFIDDLGKIGKPNTLYSALDLEPAQYRSLLADTEKTSLLSRLEKAPTAQTTTFPFQSSHRPHTYTLGQKSYAVFSMAAPVSGSVITLGPKLDSPKDWRGPIGFWVPPYFTDSPPPQEKLGRFYLDCHSSYGSENTLYPLDGNRYIAGEDPEHQGGDLWVADGVKAILQNDPEWKAIFATFGSVDKILHMLAEHESPTQLDWAVKQQLTLKATLQKADEALGRVLTALEEKGWLEETAIVVTADHGGQANQHFYGLKNKGLGTNYLFYGKAVNKVNKEIPPLLEPIVKNHPVVAISHDSGLRIWLDKKASPKAAKKVAIEVSKLPGVLEVYTLNTAAKAPHYIRAFQSPSLSPEELAWAEGHHPLLLASIASQKGPAVVVLLKDQYGYGLPGDHGGAQQWVQRIPFIIRAGNILSDKRGARLPHEVRLVDVNPMVSRLLKLPAPKELDGSAAALDGILLP